MASYFKGLGRSELESRCREATRRLKADWHLGGGSDAIEQFYDLNEGHIFDLIWWHTLRDDISPLAYVVAVDFARGRGCRHYLDFGSGVGSGAILFASHGLGVSLADISTTLLEFSRWRLARRGIPATFIDLKTSRLPNEAFDMITAMDVFEHLTDPVATVDHLARPLSAGGTFSVASLRNRMRSVPSTSSSISLPPWRASRRSASPKYGATNGFGVIRSFRSGD